MTGEELTTYHLDEIRMLQSIANYSNHESYAGSRSLAMPSSFDIFSKSLPENTRLLDAGCGPGADLKRFKSLGYEAVGIDMSRKFLSLAEQHAPVYFGDILSLPFEDRSFGAVWARESLVHMSHDLMLKSLTELHRVLKPGSPFYISVAAFDSESWRDGWRETEYGELYFHTWELSNFAYIVEARGFSISEYWKEDGYIHLFANAKGSFTGSNIR